MGLVLLVFLTLMMLFFIIWLIGKVIKSRIPIRPIPTRPSPGGPAPGGRSTMAELGWESFEIVVEDKAYSIEMKEGG